MKLDHFDLLALGTGIEVLGNRGGSRTWVCHMDDGDLMDNGTFWSNGSSASPSMTRLCFFNHLDPRGPHELRVEVPATQPTLSEGPFMSLDYVIYAAFDGANYSMDPNRFVFWNSPAIQHDANWDQVHSVVDSGYLGPHAYGAALTFKFNGTVLLTGFNCAMP